MRDDTESWNKLHTEKPVKHIESNGQSFPLVFFIFSVFNVRHLIPGVHSSQLLLGQDSTLQIWNPLRKTLQRLLLMSTETWTCCVFRQQRSGFRLRPLLSWSGLCVGTSLQPGRAGLLLLRSHQEGSVTGRSGLVQLGGLQRPRGVRRPLQPNLCGRQGEGGEGRPSPDESAQQQSRQEGEEVTRIVKQSQQTQKLLN